MRSIAPTVAHRTFRDDLISILRRHAGELDAKEMLALSAHLVGQIVAMQDQRTVTPDMAMQIVSSNIEAGNAEALSEIASPRGKA